VWDTSGSVDTVAAKTIAGNVLAMLDQFGDYEVNLYLCDAAVQEKIVITPEEPLDPDHIRFTGRGGTSFTPAFKRIIEDREDDGDVEPRTIIYFTDGEGDDPKIPEIDQLGNVIWAVIGTSRCSATFGEVVRIDPHRL
jgi:predicted metal-dependent peptidase